MGDPFKAEVMRELAPFFKNHSLTATDLATYLLSVAADEGLSNPLYVKAKDALDCLNKAHDTYYLPSQMVLQANAREDVEDICKMLKDHNVTVSYNDGFVQKVVNAFYKNPGFNPR